MSEDSPIVAHYKLRNNLHSLLLIIAMVSLLTAIGWLVAEAQGAALILLAGLILFIGFRRFSPQVILNRYHTRPLSSEDQPILLFNLQRLADSADLNETPLLYVSEGCGINAFTLKIRGQHIIVISEALLEKLDHDEVIAVLAHEVSHIYHDDINVMLLADRISQLTQSLTVIGLVMLAITPMLNLQNIPVPWQIIIGLLMGHYVSALMQLSLSRAREFYADVIAVQLTHNVTAMVSALHKIDAANHHWFKQALVGQNRCLPSLLRSHPPTQERIRCLLGLDMLSGFNPARD